MGAPKQKWTAEEEAALRAGVEKYGPGKWRAIQKDSKFGPCLTSRSNVDLKDKWRNMSVSANGLGSTRERKSLALTGGSGLMTLMEEAVAVSPLAEVAPDGMEETKPLLLTGPPGQKSLDRKSLGPRYDDMVLEAVMGLKDPNGSSNASIASYIEVSCCAWTFAVCMNSVLSYFYAVRVMTQTKAIEIKQRVKSFDC